MKESTYIDPLSDGGFKLFFGKEGKSEEFLMDFLNELFKDDPYFRNITSVQYKNVEMSKEQREGKEIRYDIHCTTSTGHKFIVEMQRKVYPDFINRSIYYVARAITEQVDNEYEFLPVVGVFVTEGRIGGLKNSTILDFQFSDRVDSNEKLDKVRMVYVQLSDFNLSEEECKTRQEKWLFILKNLFHMDRMPFTETQDRIFRKLDHYARMTNLTAADREEYEILLKHQRDMNSAHYYSKLEGLEEGRAEGRAEVKLEIARNMKALGLDTTTIAKSTGLTAEEIEKL